MNNMNELIKALHLDATLTSDNIPEIDLYMDQVIQLFERNFTETKRTAEEKIITKTMINNYSKGKLFFPVKNKKYTREHIMLIHLIYEMKTVLSISDIKQALAHLNEGFIDDDFDIEAFYNTFTEMSAENIAAFSEEGIELERQVQEKTVALDAANKTYSQQLLLILSLVNRSNYYRRAAERLVDEITAVTLQKDELK